MKSTIFAPVVASLLALAVALPAPVQTPTSVHVPVSQGPSPPGTLPKYALIKGNPLEERTPLALSRFPTDKEDELDDPSPPRPFPPGRFVEEGKPVPQPEPRDPSAPHKAVLFLPLSSDLPQVEDKSLEAGDPLSRFPTDDEKVAADPSPPRPFPPGRLVEASAGDIIEPHTPTDDEQEVVDPSPPRPFPPGRLVEVNGSSAGNVIEPRTPSPAFRRPERLPSALLHFQPSHGMEANTSTLNLTMVPHTPTTALQGTEGSDAGAAKNLSHSHPANIQLHARVDWPPNHAHGGYFPPSNPAVAEPTATLVKRSCPIHIPECRHRNPIPIPSSAPNSTSTPTPTPTAPADSDPASHPRMPFLHRPRIHSGGIPPHHWIPFATAFNPGPVLNATAFAPRPTHAAAIFNNTAATAVANNLTSTATGNPIARSTPTPCPNGTTFRHIWGTTEREQGEGCE